MPISPLGDLLRHLRRAVADDAGATDAQLLETFLQRRDEAAFEALVRRHGGLVLGTCRRVLGNPHDAEDAFQATFLVLARKAASIRARTSLPSWLFGVAYKMSLKARRSAAQRRSREREALMRPPTSPDNGLQAVIDEELSRLPEKYRTVILLCDLQEKETRKQAAEQLACPEGTVAGRLARGPAMLAPADLKKRGIAFCLRIELEFAASPHDEK